MEGSLHRFSLEEFGVSFRRPFILRDLSVAKYVDRPLGRLWPSALLGDFQGESTEEESLRIQKVLSRARATSLIGAGGGKCLDTAKLMASRLGVPLMLVPTSPATCAAWTGVIPVYHPNGAYAKTIEGSSPDLLFMDHGLLATAPPRLVAAGMVDALAKFYEPRDNRLPNPDELSLAALTLGQQLFDVMAFHGTRGLHPSRGGSVSSSRRNIHEAAISLAGAIGEWGGKPYRHGFAHSLYGGWTLRGLSKSYLHGELVGLGLLVELHLAGRTNLLRQFRGWMKKWGMPVLFPGLIQYRTSPDALKELCRHVAQYESFVPLTRPFLKYPFDALRIICP